MSHGIVYTATGEEFVGEAIFSAKRANEVMDNVPISIITDNKIQNPVFDEVIIMDGEVLHDTIDQIRYMEKSPYERTLYVDTDVYIEKDISDLFSILDEFDIAAALSQQRCRGDIELSEVPDSFIEYSSGMILYRNNKQFRKLASRWEEVCEELKISDNWPDQPAFRKVLYHSDLRIATIPPEYHIVIRQPGHVYDTVKAAHGRLLNVGHISGGGRKVVDVPTAVNKLNTGEGHRVYTIGVNGIRVHTNTIPFLIKRSIITNGATKTLKMIYDKIYRIFRNMI